MFTKVCHSLKELNLYAKLIGLLLMMISIILVNNAYLVFTLVGISIAISAILKNFESLQMSIILVIIAMFYYAHPFLLILVKVLLLYVFYLNMKSMTRPKEKRYIIDKLFYRSKSKTAMKVYLNNCFKNKKFNTNLNVYNTIDKYTRRKYSKYIINQSLIKTNYDMQDIYHRSKLSFYKFYNKKTTILDMKWSKSDNTFLLVTIFIFALVLIYR